MQHAFSLDADGRERHRDAGILLHVVGLENRAEVHSVNEQTLRLPERDNRGWICEIVAFGDSGLFVKAALSKHESSFEYFIAELDALQGLRPIAALPAVFM